jgi:uncharacterized protein YlaI
VKDWVYCPNCGHRTISQYPANRPVADFFCPTCQEQYELKSKKGHFGASVVDGAYSAMRERLASDDNPNLLLLSYSLKTFGVLDAFVIPKHFFVQEVIQERPPLAPGTIRTIAKSPRSEPVGRRGRCQRNRRAVPQSCPESRPCERRLPLIVVLRIHSLK